MNENQLQAFVEELNNLCVKEAGVSDIFRRVKGFASNAKSMLSPEVLSGSRGEGLLQKYHQKALSMPVVKQHAPVGKEQSKVIHDFISDTLRGVKEVPWASELPAQTARRLKLLQHLERGAKRVGREQQRTRNARLALTGAVATPIAATSMLKSSAMKKTKGQSIGDAAKALVPAVAAAGVGIAPTVQGLSSSALGMKPPGGKQFKDVGELRKNLRPGDIVLTSSPGKGGTFKPLISAIGGDPFGYHVESVTKVPKGGAGLPLEFLHSTPGMGGAYGYEGSLSKGEDIVVRRFKERALAKQYLGNLAKREVAEEALEGLFGAEARSTMYDKPQALRAAGKSFLPKTLQKLITRTGPTAAGMAVCSSLPGMASPVCIAPGVSGKDILPHHIRKTPALETVGRYRAARTLPQKVFERVLQTSPWLLRGALGAGLGYGAYRGVKALMNR